MPEPNTQRVRILEARYSRKTSLVLWTVKFLDGKHQDKEVRLAYRSSDLGEALGIRGKITPKQMEDFCQMMIGKEINLVMIADMKEVPNMRNMSDEELQKTMGNIYHKYPCYEIIVEEDRSQ
jgi:hypothetical protein